MLNESQKQTHTLAVTLRALYDCASNRRLTRAARREYAEAHKALSDDDALSQSLSLEFLAEDIKACQSEILKLVAEQEMFGLTEKSANSIAGDLRRARVRLTKLQGETA